jgi:hypothetical protein
MGLSDKPIADRPIYRMRVKRTTEGMDSEVDKNEKIAIEMAQEAFYILSKQNVAHGARAMAYLMCAFTRFDGFPEVWQMGWQLTHAQVQTGLTKIEVEEVPKEKFQPKERPD